MLRDRSFGHRTQPTNDATSLKTGGHGDHWGCIFRAVQQDHLFRFLQESVEQDPPDEQFAAGKGSVFRSDGEDMRVCLLTVGGKLVSAYPETSGGPLWPVTVRQVMPWANGVEGQIVGECNGAAISFFDTRFYRNGSIYRPGGTYNFSMGALAYKLEPASETEVESDIGAKISFKGACAYISAGVGEDDADIDDYWFHSPLGGKVSHVEMAGHTLASYPITIAIPMQFDMNLNLYAAEHVISPDLAERKPGDDLEGFLWLQGCLSD